MADLPIPFIMRPRTKDRNREAPSVFVSLPGERWREVPGAPAIEASNLGRVRSWRSKHGHRRHVPHLLKQRIAKDGRARIMYCQDGKHRLRMVHHLVLEAFVGPRPEGMQCRHLNGDPLDNRRKNLKWGTPKENAADKVRHGTALVGERNHQCKITDVVARDIRDSKERGVVLAARYGISQAQVSRIRNGVRRAKAA